MPISLETEEPAVVANSESIKQQGAKFGPAAEESLLEPAVESHTTAASSDAEEGDTPHSHASESSWHGMPTWNNMTTFSQGGVCPYLLLWLNVPSSKFAAILAASSLRMHSPKCACHSTKEGA